MFSIISHCIAYMTTLQRAISIVVVEKVEREKRWLTISSLHAALKRLLANGRLKS